MNANYLKKAGENLPKLSEYTVIPTHPSVEMHSGDETVIDLGNIHVGYFSFNLNYVDLYIDAPVRLYVKFCETKRELDDDFSTYHGDLCESWLQEEIINIDFPEEYKMPRRYSARYIYIKFLATPQKIRLSDFEFKSVSSAELTNLSECNCSDDLKRIDSVAVNTLKNCMQRVFEDGPKRDRRLWIGDLRLEALANYYTFKSMPIVRRSLYLLAAAPTNKYGFIPSCIYEYPKYVPAPWVLEDYSLLFVVSLCEYFNHTKDTETFFELYPIASMQMNAMHGLLDDDGISAVPDDSDVFIDWCPGLKKNHFSARRIFVYIEYSHRGSRRTRSRGQGRLCA